MIVDFHVHSDHSDGTYAPGEILSQAAGFAAVALTDHDDIGGAAEFISAPCEDGVFRVAGAEFSVDPGVGFDKFHLLALGFDCGNEKLKAFIDAVREERDARNLRITENFQRLGIDIKPDAEGGVLGRPHYARWLVQHGYASGMADAFSKYLLPDSPKESRCYESRCRPSQEDAIKVVHEAGGICLMAHPRGWCKSWRDAGCDYERAERGLRELVEKGLDGLEAIYGANTQEENVRFTMMATRLGLLKSAGSDFHGENKPDVRLGMNVEEDFITPLIERLQR